MARARGQAGMRALRRRDTAKNTAHRRRAWHRASPVCARACFLVLAFCALGICERPAGLPARRTRLGPCNRSPANAPPRPDPCTRGAHRTVQVPPPAHVLDLGRLGLHRNLETLRHPNTSKPPMGCYLFEENFFGQICVFSIFHKNLSTVEVFRFVPLFFLDFLSYPSRLRLHRKLLE